MSLATRCTACGTVFRVVQDQLKVSEGWVRCGRCNEVFNALEGLFDLERDAPPPGLPEPSPRVPPSPVPERAAPAPWEMEPVEEESDALLVDKIDAQLLGSRWGDIGSTPATRINERDRLEFPDARFNADLLTDETVASDLGYLSRLPEEAEGASSEPPAPEFVQRATRQARWRRPGMRATLGVAALVLTVTLGLQAGHHFRDLISARWPAAQPALVAWCGWVSCRIEAPRHLEDVFVESSSLVRASAPDAFMLSLALRNRGAMTVAFPSVDLSLTDVTGQLVARRMLGPRDFGTASTLLPPGAESALQLVLSAGSGRISGYTVEVFYP